MNWSLPVPGKNPPSNKLAAARTCLALLLLVPPVAARAASPAGAFAPPDTLVVTADPWGAPDSPSTSGMVTRIELDGESGFRSVADLLGATAGFQVLRTGALGSTAVPSLRGSTAGQIRFYLDGAPLDAARSGTVPLEDLPLERVAALEIHRGVVPTRLGGVGGAGAVNLITDPEAAPTGVEARVGSFGEIGGRAVASGTHGSLDGVLLVNARRADNDFEFTDHNQTFHRMDDDLVRTRRNAWAEQWSLWGSGSWRTEALTVRAAAGHRRREGGRPGPLGYESPHARVRYERTDLQVHAGARDEGVRFMVAGGVTDDRLDDPAGEVGLGPAGQHRSRERDLAVRARWSYAASGGLLDLEIGAGARGRWGTESFRGLEDPENERRQATLTGAVTLRAAGGRLLVTPSWRWQRTRDDFPPPPPPFPTAPRRPGGIRSRDDTSPALGAVWAIVPSRLFLEAHAARTVRHPTWTELFGLRGGIDGNPELGPEQLEAFDVAAGWRPGSSFRIRAAFFTARAEDRIVFRQNSQRTARAENIGRTRVRGVEIETAALLPEGLSLRANASWQRAVDAGGDPAYDGKRLPFLPDGEAHGRLTWSRGGWRPWIEAAWMSSNYRDRYNVALNEAPSRALLNLGLARRLRPRWLGPAGALTVAAEAVNLTGNDVYDLEGFPLPGRSWHLSVKVES